MHTVAKPFKTVNRKFYEIGEPVTPSDIVEGSPLTFTQLKEGGFITKQRVDYDALPRPELDALAAERRIDVSGARSKAEVVSALQQHERLEEAIDSGNLEILHRADLDRLAAVRNIDTSGVRTKADLIELLLAHSETLLRPVNPAPEMGIAETPTSI